VVAIVAGLVVVLEVSCLTCKVEDLGADEVWVSERDDRLDVEDESTVVVESGATPKILAVISTGQNDHTWRASSQYRSNSNLRKPEVRRLLRQSPESSSSYLKSEKQAAVKDTPGFVT
jgi:hypothetical protein